jgi:alpha-N-arabinofuranosidase
MLLRAVLSLLLAVSAMSGADTVVTLDLAHDAGAPNRRALGHNLEAADPRGVFVPLDAVDWNREPIRTGEGFWDPLGNTVVPAVDSRLRDLGTRVLRYPGGSLAGGWDWHQSVGPVASRGDWTFGLPEFLAGCAALGAEPLITLSDYTGTPQDLADLVEFLNAPADGHHPWADQRAAWGHPTPWGVRWFELGNETSLGTFYHSPNRRMSPAEYVTWATDAATRIKAVDASVQLGVVTVPGTLEEPDETWNREVLTGTGSWADFVVLHLYAPVVADGSSADQVAPPCLAAADQFMGRIAAYRSFVTTCTGKDLPFWLTEFNVMAVQETPQPYRFSWAAAVLTADLQRQLLAPDSGVAGACYWQMLNGYWGGIETRLGGIIERGPFLAQRFLARHLGERLVPCTVSGPTFDVPSFPGFWRCSGTSAQPPLDIGAVSGTPLALGALSDPWTAASLIGDTLGVHLSNITANAYSGILTSYARPAAATQGCSYRIAFSARFTPDPGSGTGLLGLSAIDSRGWAATGSGISITGVETAGAWQDFVGTFLALDDAPGIDLSLRLESPTAAVNGLLELRALTVTAKTLPLSPAVPQVAATASRSGDQARVLLINRSASDPARVVLHGAAASGVTWDVLASSHPGDTIAPDTDFTGVALVPASDGTYVLTIPPAGMTGVGFAVISGTTTGGGTTSGGTTSSGTGGGTSTPANDGGGNGCGAGAGMLAITALMLALRKLLSADR